jgi:hypothetical protein
VLDDPPTTSAALTARNRAALAALDGAIAGLSDEQLVAPNTAGDWSLRDVLAHLSAEWLPAQLEAFLGGREPTAVECFGDEVPPGPEFDLSTQDGRNAWHHARDAALTLDQVRERFARYRRRMDALLARLSDEDLAATYVLEPLGYVHRLRRGADGEAGVPLWRWIQGNTWHHYEQHLEAFRRTEG